jgi:1-phosphatidylinositol phosphodiesterase
MTNEPRCFGAPLRLQSTLGRMLALPLLALLFAGCAATVDDGERELGSSVAALDDGEGEALPELVDDLVQDPSRTAARFTVASFTVGASGRDWMATVENDRLLSNLSIPGSHDSAAFVEPVSGTAKCQNLSLTDQLNVGVRFLDIRCRHINDGFAIHHGSIYQNQNFDDVLNAVIGFLNAHPTEAVIMSVKEEHTASNNTRSFADTFDSYVQKNPGKWNFNGNISTLGEARGKITLFRRFGGADRGISASYWPDKTTFSSGNLRVQDNYAVTNTSTKWNQIKGLIDEAYAGSASTLYVNFASGVGSIFGIPNIPGVANPINQKVSSFFSSAPRGRYGIIIMDFVDSTRASRVYNSNVN